YGTISVTSPANPYPYTLITVPYANSIKGVTDGLEIAPSWKPAEWWTLRGSFSHLHMGLHSKTGYQESSYVDSYEGTAPHRQANLQSLLDLPHGIHVDADYRFMSALPAQKVASYQTADGRVAWSVGRHYELSVVGRNLLQPAHQEFPGNNSNAVGIRRSVFAELTWTP
ncbi:MAG TPA: TonB-dependent receptor, partial [Acidobacteriaceae bacterium]|nr:TonB-dependent receptor [Acidobacteriaceae bacterium]